MGTHPVIKMEMSSGEFEFGFESSTGDGPGSREDSRAVLLQLFGKAVLVAMVEDWTAESLELYRSTGQGLPVRELPDDTIFPGSELGRGLMRQLAGAAYPLDQLSDMVVVDFLALVVSGTRVMEDETASCRVFWVSRGAVADPVFVLGEGTQ